MLPVMTVLVRRQLGWGPDVMAGWEDVWAVSDFSGVHCIPADSYLPTPLHFPTSDHFFLLEFSTYAYL